mmetsp:Transcript_5638/g.21227  ORF Transcript_5638/g.21227 Transcript_5638/m.21227 type:complete len:102 (-) Transcript_5638:159-464(-)
MRDIFFGMCAWCAATPLWWCVRDVLGGGEIAIKKACVQQQRQKEISSSLALQQKKWIPSTSCTHTLPSLALLHTQSQILSCFCTIFDTLSEKKKSHLFLSL